MRRAHYLRGPPRERPELPPPPPSRDPLIPITPRFSPMPLPLPAPAATGFYTPPRPTRPSLTQLSGITCTTAQQRKPKVPIM